MRLTIALLRGRGGGGFGGRGGGGMFGRGRGSPSPAPRAPPPRAAPAAPPAAAPRAPGLMGQMAATAGGVAVGSVVGHGLSQAIFGGGQGHGGQGAPQAAPQGGQYGDQGYNQSGAYAQPQQQAQPCEGEMGQFVQCAMNSENIEDCIGYLNTLKKCRDEVMARYA